MRKKTQEEVIQDFIRIHGNKYNYSNVEYSTNKIKVAIVCKKHGEFKQKPNDHISGRGCPMCCKLFKDTTNTFITKALKIHKNKYNYSKVVYIDSKSKVKIICKEHGEFEQSPNRHLSGNGCPKCSYLQKGYSRSNYVNQANGKLAILYLIKCWSETEEFYKIGITLNSVKKRYVSSKSMPYNYSVVKQIIGEAGVIYDLEKNKLKALRPYKYIPRLQFKGFTECIKLEESEIIKKLV